MLDLASNHHEVMQLEEPLVIQSDYQYNYF